MEFNSETLMPLLTAWALKLILALVIFIVGKWISKRITAVVRKLMERAELDTTLVNFLCTIVYAILLAAVVLGALFTTGGLALSYGPDLATGPVIILLAGGTYLLTAAIRGLGRQTGR